MATRVPTITRNPNGQANCMLVSWTGLLNGDDGTPVEMGDYADFTAQFQGTPGAGLSVNLEGSVDSTNYVVLTDPQGNVITKTSVGVIELCEEGPRMVRPRVTAGDGTTSLTVTLWARRGR